MKPHNQYILALRDLDGHDWATIAKMVNSKYGAQFTPNAARKRYGRLKGRYNDKRQKQMAGSYHATIPNELPSGWEVEVVETPNINNLRSHIAEVARRNGITVTSCKWNSSPTGDISSEAGERLAKEFFHSVGIKSTKNTLVIGDLHLPFIHKDYLAHCQRVQEKYNCDEIVFIGDVFESHALGFWPHDPSGMSAGSELSQAIASAQPWYKAFPVAKICIGNHDERYFRQAFKAGIPTAYLRGYNEVFKCPDNWNWQHGHTMDNVLYAHGTGYTGKDAAMRVASESMMSAVIGHTHSWGGVQWIGTHNAAIFALNVGCGVDESAYPMRYAAHMRRKPVLGCGVVLDSGRVAHFEPMVTNV